MWASTWSSAVIWNIFLGPGVTHVDDTSESGSDFTILSVMSHSTLYISDVRSYPPLFSISSSAVFPENDARLRISGDLPLRLLYDYAPNPSSLPVSVASVSLCSAEAAQCMSNDHGNLGRDIGRDILPYTKSSFSKSSYYSSISMEQLHTSTTTTSDLVMPNHRSPCTRIQLYSSSRLAQRPLFSISP